MTCSFALFAPFAFISTGLCLWLRIVAVFLFLRAAPREPCLRMRCPFSCTRSFMGLRPPVLRLVQSVPMTSVGSLPRLLFTVTGPSPRCLTRPPGAPVQFLPLFTCETFNTSFKVFALWVRSWRRVRDRVALTSSQFVLGEEEILFRPCLRCSAVPGPVWRLLVVMACPSSSCPGLGVSRFIVFFCYILLFILFMCILFICIVRVPA